MRPRTAGRRGPARLPLCVPQRPDTGTIRSGGAGDPPLGPPWRHSPSTRRRRAGSGYSGPVRPPLTRPASEAGGHAVPRMLSVPGAPTVLVPASPRRRPACRHTARNRPCPPLETAVCAILWRNLVSGRTLWARFYLPRMAPCAKSPSPSAEGGADPGRIRRRIHPERVSRCRTGHSAAPARSTPPPPCRPAAPRRICRTSDALAVPVKRISISAWRGGRRLGTVWLPCPIYSISCPWRRTAALGLSHSSMPSLSLVRPWLRAAAGRFAVAINSSQSQH